MIHLKRVKTLSGSPEDFTIDSTIEKVIDGEGLTLLPALIDPHVHFRLPGATHKEDWKTGALAAVRGGVTTVFDMPNNIPACNTMERMDEKKQLIDTQLHSVGIPLHYGLYLGADESHLEEISHSANKAVGIKVFMGCSTGDLLIDSKEALDEVFRRAAETDQIVAVHAEDEKILQEAKRQIGPTLNPAMHSRIRPREAAIKAVETALELSKKYRTRLYVLHMSTKEELELVKQAKKENVPVFAEVTTHHLFLSEQDYATWGTFVQMNPPLRTKQDQEALWEGINDGSIDTIGTDHAPHTLAEKQLPFGKAPSGIPGVETLLPLMLDAVSQEKLSLNRLVELTRTNIERLFRIPSNNDWVLVDLNLEKTVDAKELCSKCGWSPYVGRRLRGWPIYTLLGGHLFPAAAYQDTQLGVR